jgi:hypothetical protein
MVDVKQGCQLPFLPDPRLPEGRTLQTAHPVAEGLLRINSAS